MIVRVAEQTRTEMASECVLDLKPTRFNENCVRLVREAAQRLGYRHRDIVSGPGHDAVNVSSVTPTAMVFIPCVDGISHNELEEAREEELAAGANVLMHAILECDRTSCGAQ